MCVSDMLIDKQLYFLNTENCLIFASAERGLMFECLNVRMLECLNGGLGGLEGLEFRSSGIFYPPLSLCSFAPLR